jgi:hypothetical protein
MRSLAYEYALQLQPKLAPLREVFDALELAAKCNHTAPESKPRPPPLFPTPSDALFVDYSNGDDSNTGSIQAPFKTLNKAVEVSFQMVDPKSANGGATSGRTIVLRSGIHYLGDTVELTPEHSGLTIQNYEGEEAWVSGGTRLDGIVWAPYDTQLGNYCSPCVLSLPK